MEIEVEVSVAEFLEGLSKSELNTLIEYLVEDGYVIRTGSSLFPHFDKKYIAELEWESVIKKLLDNRLSLSNKEQSIIEEIANRF